MLIMKFSLNECLPCFLGPPLLQDIQGDSRIARYNSTLNFRFFVLGGPVLNVTLEILPTSDSQWRYVPVSVSFFPYLVYWVIVGYVPYLRCEDTVGYRFVVNGKHIVMPDKPVVVLGMKHLLHFISNQNETFKKNSYKYIYIYIYTYIYMYIYIYIYIYIYK